MAPKITHRIGPFRFFRMSPCPPTRRRRTLIETRAGADGFALWLDGTRGELWTPETVVDVPDHLEAQQLKVLYEESCGGPPVEIEYVTDEDNPFDTLIYPDVVIKDVQVSIVDQLIGIGGFYSLPKALVRANWTIIIR